MAEFKAERRRGILTEIFISPDEPRLRAGWRLFAQTILMVALTVAASLLMLPLMRAEDPFNNLFLAQVTQILAFSGSVLLARRFLDRRTVVSLGLRVDRLAWLDVTAGIVITFVLMAAIYLGMVIVGWSSFESFAWETDPLSTVVSSTLGTFVLFILVGWNEELLSRGYHLQTIASGLNLLPGWILSSAIFGLLHIFNPNATWVSAAGIFFAGLFLGYGYIRTKQLWLPIGLHIGWNFFEGAGFGFPVSGLEIYRLLRHQVRGPELWTGGAFGPEAGLIVLPALALGAWLIHVYVRSFRKSTE